MLSVSRAPHRDARAAEGARLTLSIEGGAAPDPRLRRLTRAFAAGYPQGSAPKGLLALTRLPVASRDDARDAAAPFVSD